MTACKGKVGTGLFRLTNRYKSTPHPVERGILLMFVDVSVCRVLSSNVALLNVM